jgi:hypothetical protein
MRIESNPVAVKELRSVWERLQVHPRSVGIELSLPNGNFWVYESPRMPGRARLRVLYSINETKRVVSIEALDLL